MRRRWSGIVLVAAAGVAAAQAPSAEVPPPAPPSQSTPLPPPPEPQPFVEPLIACTPHNGCKPGWFGSVDFSFLFPHVKHDLRGSVPIAISGPAVDFQPPFTFESDVRLPFAQLDSTLSPKFTAGWRFADDRGAVQATYRFLASEGGASLPTIGFLPDGVLFSRLDINEVGMAYSTREHPLGALWSLRWEFGARLATIFHDTQAHGLIAEQRSSNHFVGAGPQVALDIAREIPDSGLALYARIDAAEYVGRIQQRFQENSNVPGVNGFGYSERDGSQAVPFVGVQAGISWLALHSPYRATLGYEFNQWWNTGRLADSRCWVQAQGLFFRTEFHY